MDTRAREVEIDVRDLMKTLISHWKSILLCGVIVMILIAGLSAAGGSDDEDIVTEEQAQADYDKALAKYEASLPDYEVNLDVYRKLVDLKGDVLDGYMSVADALKAKLAEWNALDAGSEAWLEKGSEVSSLESTFNSNKSLYETLNKLTEPEKPKAPVMEEVTEVSRFSVKAAIAGFLIGAALMCAVWGTIYMTDGTVKTPGSLIELFNVKLLGPAGKCGLVAANIRNYIPEGTGRLLFTGTADEETMLGLSEALAGIAPGLELSVAGGLNDSAETAGLLMAVDAVVLVEKLKKSKLSEIEEEIMMVRGSGKELVGISI